MPETIESDFREETGERRNTWEKRGISSHHPYVFRTYFLVIFSALFLCHRCPQPRLPNTAYHTIQQEQYWAPIVIGNEAETCFFQQRPPFTSRGWGAIGLTTLGRTAARFLVPVRTTLLDCCVVQCVVYLFCINSVLKTNASANVRLEIAQNCERHRRRTSHPK